LDKRVQKAGWGGVETEGKEVFFFSRSFFWKRLLFRLFVFLLFVFVSLLLSRDVLGVVRRGQRLLRGLVVLGAAEEHNLCFFVGEKMRGRKK